MDVFCHCMYEYTDARDNCNPYFGCYGSPVKLKSISSPPRSPLRLPLSPTPLDPPHCRFIPNLSGPEVRHPTPIRIDPTSPRNNSRPAPKCSDEDKSSPLPNGTTRCRQPRLDPRRRARSLEPASSHRGARAQRRDDTSIRSGLGARRRDRR